MDRRTAIIVLGAAAAATVAYIMLSQEKSPAQVVSDALKQELPHDFAIYNSAGQECYTFKYGSTIVAKGTGAPLCEVVITFFNYGGQKEFTVKCDSEGTFEKSVKWPGDFNPFVFGRYEVRADFKDILGQVYATEKKMVNYVQ
ncbi:MAG: hypothetical protein QXS29_06105 [Nitrososphaeria archaeon]